MENPLVSVIIPCYNHGPLVQQAIDSIYQQHYPNFEIIVVDDGSHEAITARSLALIDDPKVTILRKQNGGPASARNYGIKAAKGPLIFNLDADDSIEPGLFAKAVQLMKSDDKIGIVTCGVVVNGYNAGRWIPQSTSLPTLLARSDIAPGSMFRQQCWVDVGGYDESENLKGIEDYDFWLRILAFSWSIQVIEEWLYNYNRSESGLCTQLIHKNMKATQNFIDKHAALYECHWRSVIGHMRYNLEETQDLVSALNQKVDQLFTSPEYTLGWRIRSFAWNLKSKLGIKRRLLFAGAQSANPANNKRNIASGHP